MNGFSSHKLFAKKASEPIAQTQAAWTATGNSYAIATDNAQYVMLAFLSPVFDENLKRDAQYLVPFYFQQGCYCVTMWFRNESVSQYLIGVQYTLDNTKHYYAFFNQALEQEAKDVKGKFSAFFPVSLTDPYIFCSTDEDGQQHVYKIFNGKAMELNPEPPDLDYKFGQYYGYIQRNTGEKEFIFSYALDVS